jgi:hypothetical protein
LADPSQAAPASPQTAPAANANSGNGGVQYVSPGQNVAASPAGSAANADAWTAMNSPAAPSDAFWLLWSEDLTQDVFGATAR